MRFLKTLKKIVLSLLGIKAKNSAVTPKEDGATKVINLVPYTNPKDTVIEKDKVYEAKVINMSSLAHKNVKDIISKDSFLGKVVSLNLESIPVQGPLLPVATNESKLNVDQTSDMAKNKHKHRNKNKHKSVSLPAVKEKFFELMYSQKGKCEQLYYVVKTKGAATTANLEYIMKTMCNFDVKLLSSMETTEDVFINFNKVEKAIAQA